MNKLIQKYTPLFFQLTRFGIVGVTAAAVHFSVVIALVQFALIKQPLYANAVGFFFAFQISYSGHRFWTFRDTRVAHRAALPKLLLVSLSGFLVNETLFYCLMTLLGLPYQLALLVVLTVMPAITFTLSKLWVFA